MKNTAFYILDIDGPERNAMDLIRNMKHAFPNR